MNAPITALAWEIWRRGRRSAWLALACVGSCVFINLVLIGWLHISEAAQGVFSTLFGMLMAISFLLLMGIFNYTEYSSTKEWNGFPYRLFTLPIRTWQLVALPMFLGVVFVEMLYFVWIKLVWTRESILPSTAGWFAVVLGTYVIFYQTTLWCLAGFRIVRIVALGLGGVSCIAVAAAPFFAMLFHLDWVTEKFLTAIMIGLATAAYVTAWLTVASQRCGGGRRRSWVMALANRLVDALPKRTKDFASPAAAQFWFEWRRTGWLLPACTTFVIVAIFLPISWFKRHDPQFINYILVRILATPLVLAFVLGKGFIQPEFWSTNPAFPNFLAVRPLPAREFVTTKLKVAAGSVVITWLLVLASLALWLELWANTTGLKFPMYAFHTLYPHSWVVITVLSCAALMVLTWRLMVGGLWVGLAGSRPYYAGAWALQVLIPALLLLADGIWSDTIDREIKDKPVLMQTIALNGIGWLLAVLVAAKFWFAAFSWNQADRNFRRRYLIIWAGALVCLLTLAVLASPRFDTYRFEHLYVLGAFLMFPLARIGMAPLSLAKNRHR